MIKELNVVDRNESTQRRPDWLRVKLPSGEKFKEVSETVRNKSLNTVCSEARCPNMGECWGNGTATFMILGDVCTRSCSFCAVKTGRPVQGLDWDEPRRVTEAAKEMDLKHVVLTSVNRDEREDGGAPIFAECHKQLREAIDGVTIESLIPDFLKDADSTTFLQKLHQTDNYWKERLEKSQNTGKTLRYTGSLRDDSIRIGIQETDKQTPIGQLTGTNNLIQIKTERYYDQPLIIQGPGAGKEVTAAGVLSDILKISG